MPQNRPFRDGLDENRRRRLRREFWKNPPLDRIRRRNWTEKLCTECKRWIRREEPCEHLKPEVSSGPAVRSFEPFFHPNAQPGGVWIRNSRELRECLKLNRTEPAY